VIRYGVRVSAPESVDDEIVDLPDKWVRLIMVDVAANLLSGVDIDAVSQEYITEQLRLERFPVRSGESIQRALITVREYLMERFRNEQKALTPPPVRRLDVVEL
jgi:hypothetical protein